MGFAVGGLEVADAVMAGWVVMGMYEIMGRPLHHTLRIATQEVTSSGGDDSR